MTDKAGTYTGSNGLDYRWTVNGSGNYTIEVAGGGSGIPRADWPAARAALDALVAEEAEQWVEIDGRTRASRNGKKVQYLVGSGMWQPVGSIKAACYRAGLRIGREDARELAEAVAHPQYDGALAGTLMRIDTEWWCRCTGLARELLGEDAE